MPNPITPETIRDQLSKHDLLSAYTDALTLFAAQPASYELGILLLQVALAVERTGDMLRVLADLSERVPAQSAALLLCQIHLLEGDFAQSWDCLAQTGLPSNSLLYHELAYRIALQQHDLALALQHLLAIEALGKCSLAHFFKKFDVLKQQGQYAQIKQELGLLLAQVPPNDSLSIWQLRLWYAGIAHEEARFAEGIAMSQALIAEFLASPWAQQSASAASVPKSWTRQKQHRIIRELEWLIVQNALPMFMVAGSLLSLVREGDFFLCDKDLDLGVLDGDFAQALAVLVQSGYFEDISPANYFVGFAQLRHRVTGFVVDVTQYQTRGDKVHAVWAHVSGAVLRETMFDGFKLQAAFYPSLRCRVLIPDQPELYLTQLYGDWRTPDPYFDTVVAACNLRELSPFLISFGLIKICHALFNHRRHSAKISVQHLQAHGVQFPFFQQIYELP